ncbi:MAG TPA: urate hydroxylase PuuD [Dongiaceae bacterium]|jgi:uncharacterized membrane protein|nr:urate hydroxylase PuuD [Dongiaceae bacterium]
MGKFFESLNRVLVAGVVLAVVAFLILHLSRFEGSAYLAFILRAIHVWFGILWIGLLYYFNFVQIPSMPKIPDEQKPAVGKVIAPAALFYFRWAAALTMLLGLALAEVNGYLGQALAFQPGFATIGLGMWLGLIMGANVWGIIWPNQKRALGIVQVDADAKKKAARTAMIASRVNTMLSIPMLYCMVGQSHFG